MKKYIKYIYSILALVMTIPFIPFRIVIDQLCYIKRSIYSQWKRMTIAKSTFDLIISYPCDMRGGKYIQCGKGVFLGPNGILAAWDTFHGKKYSPQIIIGNNVTIGTNFHISAIGQITIGDNVLMGKGVTIVDNGHGYPTRDDMDIDPKKRNLRVYGPLTIEKNVWIGDKVTIIGGITIGQGAIIGSNSVVTKDIPPYSVVVGIPAKIIKQL